MISLEMKTMTSRRTGTTIATRTRSRRGRAAAAGLGGVFALTLGLAACSAPGSADEAWVPAGSPAVPAASPDTAPAAPAEAPPAPSAIVPGDAAPIPAAPSPAAATAPEEQVAMIPTRTLTAEEVAGLLWMREEEKLARDVYLALADVWDAQVFSNIARSEQAHMDQMETLLDTYGLQDPAAGNPAGVFTDPAIQALYDELLASGRTSLVEALKVGATIEDLDIVDLQKRATDTPDIAQVYANLEMGSRNHLRAFITNLERQGATYTPSYLSQADFDEIVSSPRERGTRATTEVQP